MIFTERQITVHKGKSSINEPVILYRGDYEVSIKFTIMESKFRFKSGVNLVDSEKASFGQLAILAPYGGNVFSEAVKCEDGTVTFTLTKEMIDQLEEVGLYSFQIRLFDYYRESRVSIPPVEFGIEVREPVASEDHDNSVNNAIVGYSIAKVVDPSKENVGDTFDANGNYNKTEWETGDRISEGKLNKIEDAIDKINKNELNDITSLTKIINSNYNILETTKVNKGDMISVKQIDKNKGKIDQTYLSDELISQIGGNTAVNAIPADNSITTNKLAEKAVASSRLSPDMISKINEGIFTDNLIINDNILEYPSLAGSSTNYNLSKILKYDDELNLIAHATNSNVIYITKPDLMTMPIEISCEFYVDVNSENGVLLGVAGSATEGNLNRNYLGYEPVYKSIVTYINGKEFTKLKEITASQNCKFKIIMHNDHMICYVNDELLGDFPIVDGDKYFRMQAKIRSTEWKLKNLKVSVAEIDEPINNLADNCVKAKNISSGLLTKFNKGVFTNNLIAEDDILSYPSIIASNVEFNINQILQYTDELDIVGCGVYGDPVFITKPESIEFPVEISFDYYIEANMQNGIMVGFAGSTSVSSVGRSLFGYEPAYNSFSAFVQSKGFTNFKTVTDNKLYNFKIRFIDNIMKCYVDNMLIGECDTNDCGHLFRIQVKAKSKSEKWELKNLKVSKIEIEELEELSGTLVYRFGGKGNDHCFVRLPKGYDSKRTKPYPFVICNHGNGWNMDGTMAKANWTKRTMYVPLNDSDYMKNPSQYNGTDDQSLWYSNPTIETLLNAGYIVCGAQNYGDNLYGNDDCRNACVDFFEHMVQTYNVEQGCHMIGASNGAMTTLNAVYLLGHKVKSVILQYPLTCLWLHYSNYSAHQAAIQKAYGIDSGLSESDFKKQTRTHDPLLVNTINGVKIGYFPPTKIWYSSQDTTTKSSNNAIPFLEMLENSNMINESVVASGEHGDYTHFDPSEYLAWFEKYN